MSTNIDSAVTPLGATQSGEFWQNSRATPYAVKQGACPAHQIWQLLWAYTPSQQSLAMAGGWRCEQCTRRAERAPTLAAARCTCARRTSAASSGCSKTSKTHILPNRMATGVAPYCQTVASSHCAVSKFSEKGGLQAAPINAPVPRCYRLHATPQKVTCIRHQPSPRMPQTLSSMLSAHPLIHALGHNHMQWRSPSKAKGR
jgi:hypothetical protein